MKNNTSLIALLFCLLSCAATATGQRGHFEITGDQTTFDGLQMGVRAGDTIFVAAGNRDALQIDNITGTVTKPVVIINRGGKVIINTKKDYGILVNNSVYFKITGTGSAALYGFEIASTANHGLVVTEFSSCCEADHLEVHDIGYAAFVAKTDPNCTRKDMRYFIMRNLSFHDNLIHDTHAEGFYVGYSWYPSREFTCGADSLLYPHEIHGVRIYNNIIRHSGQEGIQVGTGTRDILIYNNTVDGYGATNTLWQNHGIQIGQGTTGDFFNNRVSNGPGEAISLFGGGNNRVYNNIIINSGAAAAIYQNDRSARAGTHYQITDNIIVHPKEAGIMLMSRFTTGNIVTRNRIALDTPAHAILFAGQPWDSAGNKVYDLSTGVSFADTVLHGKKITSTFPFAKDSSVAVLMNATPASDRYTFSVPVKEPAFVIYDHAGIVLPQRIIAKTGKQYSMDLTGLESGIYYVSVLSGGKPQQLLRVICSKQAKGY